MDKYELIARVALGLQLAWSDFKDTWDLVEAQDLSLYNLQKAIRLLHIPSGDSCLSLGFMRDVVSNLYSRDYEGNCPICGVTDLEIVTPMATWVSQEVGYVPNNDYLKCPRCGHCEDL